MPISFVLFLVGNSFGREYIYTNWLHGPPREQGGLAHVRPRVLHAISFVLAVGAVLTLVFLRTSFRPALAGAAERATRAKGMFASWTADWRGDDAEREASRARLRMLAPIICLCYAFGYTLVAFDQVMSLTPTWFSNIFGWYFLVGRLPLGGVGDRARVRAPARDYAGLGRRDHAEPRMHDLGKMIFAFSIFWMYLFFAQYIVIWYGNLPEETQFFQARLGPQFLQDSWNCRAGSCIERART